ncbi:unnamed protein product [Alternaria burnsii]|nr:unnamed protein product [Alternaria burnsii]
MSIFRRSGNHGHVGIQGTTGHRRTRRHVGRIVRHHPIMRQYNMQSTRCRVRQKLEVSKTVIHRPLCDGSFHVACTRTQRREHRLQ